MSLKEDNYPRRDFIKKTTSLIAGSVVVSSWSNLASGFTIVKGSYPVQEGGKYVLAPLPYAYDALEPHIDTLTMEIHHSKHHQGYVNNLNKALEQATVQTLPNQTLETIFKNVAKLSPAIRNNAGGHYNHTLFWSLMKANGGGEPTGMLAEAINKQFGSFNDFKNKFSEAAKTLFGSGWVWLIYEQAGTMAICTTPNQDNPLMSDTPKKGMPILALDVWEHAYYLKNQNRRADYIASWWNVVNWGKVGDLYNEAAGK